MGSSMSEVNRNRRKNVRCRWCGNLNENADLAHGLPGPSMDAARHDVLVAVACGAGIRKASCQFVTAVAFQRIRPIGLVVGLDADNLPALGQPDLATAAFQAGRKRQGRAASSGASMTQPTCGSSGLP